MTRLRRSLVQAVVARRCTGRRRGGKPRGPGSGSSISGDSGRVELGAARLQEGVGRAIRGGGQLGSPPHRGVRRGQRLLRHGFAPAAGRTGRHGRDRLVHLRAALVSHSTRTTASTSLPPGSPTAKATTGIWYASDIGRTRGTFPSGPTRIAPTGNGEPVLKASNGHLWLVDVSGWCCVGDGTVQLRTNVSGSWTVSTIGRGQEPSFRLGTDHRAQVASQRGDTALGIYYARAATTSGGFSTAPDVPATNAHDNSPVLALSANNKPWVAWTHFKGSRRASGGSPHFVRLGHARPGNLGDLGGEPVRLRPGHPRPAERRLWGRVRPRTAAQRRVVAQHDRGQPRRLPA